VATLHKKLFVSLRHSKLFNATLIHLPRLGHMQSLELKEQVQAQLNREVIEMHSCISILALLVMSTAAATNTTIIIEPNETITTNEKGFLADRVVDDSRVNYDTDANNNAFFDGRNHNENDGRTSAPITPTLWPTYAPTPLTKAPTTPIPTYSPTEEQKIPSPTASPVISSPKTENTPNPSASPKTSSPTPKPVYYGATAIPTYIWRRETKRNLRHQVGQYED